MAKRQGINDLTNIEGIELNLIQDWLNNGRSQQRLAECLNMLEIARSQMLVDQDKNALL